MPGRLGKMSKKRRGDQGGGGSDDGSEYGEGTSRSYAEAGAGGSPNGSPRTRRGISPRRTAATPRGKGGSSTPRQKGGLSTINEKKGSPQNTARSGNGGEDEEDENEAADIDWDGDESEVDDDPNAHRLKPWFIGLAKYIIFIVTFTYIQIGLRPTADMRQFTSLWDIAIGQSLGNVVFVDSMWRFLEGPVVSLVSDDYFQQVEAYWPEDENSYIYGNRRMGNVRLRQVRVQTAGCMPTQTQFIQQDASLPPMCYPQYDLSSDEGNSDYVWKNTTYTRSQSTVMD